MKLQKTMKKNLYLMVGIVCIALFLFLPFISAVPPVTSEFVGDVGLDIEANVQDYYKINEGACLHIYVFNKTDGVNMDNTTASCSVELTDHNGTVKLLGTPTGHLNHFEMCRNSTIVDSAEIYGLTIVCNTSEIAGYKTHFFEATITGNETPENLTSVFAVMILVLFGISCLFIFLGFKIEAPGFKIFFMLLGFVFLLGCLGFALVVGFNSNVVSEITTMNLVFVYAIGLVLVLVFAFALIKQITSTLDMMREKKGYEVGF